MATNNQNNDSHGPHNSVHPEDILEAFGLDALGAEEELSVQDHLDCCDRCSDVVGRYQATAAELAGSVQIQEPPVSAAPVPQLVPSFGDRLIDSRLVRTLVPLGASLAMVLVVFAVTMNVRISNEVDDLKQENASLQTSLNSNLATMTAQISEA